MVLTKKTFYLNLAHRLYFNKTDVGQDNGVINYLGRFPQMSFS